MTTLTLMQAIGKNVRIKTGLSSLDVDVKVIDSKMTYGVPRLHVAPLAGEGSAWIELSRVQSILGSSGHPSDLLQITA